MSHHPRYTVCPLLVAGFSLHHFAELPAQVIGPDGRCLCTEGSQCLDPDRHDGQRCSLEDLRRLDGEARRRRAWQGG